MATRHDKNVERKLRAKERKNAIATFLRAEPLRPINTRGLQKLQQVLGLCHYPDFLSTEEAYTKNLTCEKSNERADSRVRSSNCLDVPVIGGVSETPIPPRTKISN